MPSLSDLWRENRSKDPGIELAGILDAARIMAQSLIPNTEVTFSGVKHARTDRKTIELSARGLGDEFPVPGEKVDCLLGLTVHEMGHILFSPSKNGLINQLCNKLRIYYRQDKNLFASIVNVLEDLYVDHLLGAYPGYRDYLRHYYADVVAGIDPKEFIDILGRKVTRTELLNAFCYIALIGHSIPGSILPENLTALSSLSQAAMGLCSKKLSREKAITQAWKVISAFPDTVPPEEPEPPPAPRPQGQTPDEARDESQEQTPADSQDEEQSDGQVKEDEGQKEEESEEGSGYDEDREKQEQDNEVGFGATDDQEQAEPEPEEEQVPPIKSDDVSLSEIINNDLVQKQCLEDNIANEVSEAIVENRADLTQMLSNLARNSSHTIVAYTPQEDADLSQMARQSTQQVEDKLRRILQDYRLRRTEDYRGLYSGRVSSRRLHRVGYGDKRVFQRREKPGEIDMAICLLMDMSGSVASSHSLINEVVVALSDAFQKERLEFISIGYSDLQGVCYIPRLYDRETQKPLLGIDRRKTWGGTPSYEGLAAAVAQLLRLGGAKNKILFHFTDGAPNTRWDIPELLVDAREKGIKDIHIGLGDTTDTFRSLYGNTERIYNILDLPDIIESLLREELKV